MRPRVAFDDEDVLLGNVNINVQLGTDEVC